MASSTAELPSTEHSAGTASPIAAQGSVGTPLLEELSDPVVLSTVPVVEPSASAASAVATVEPDVDELLELVGASVVLPAPEEPTGLPLDDPLNPLLSNAQANAIGANAMHAT